MRKEHMTILLKQRWLTFMLLGLLALTTAGILQFVLPTGTVYAHSDTKKGHFPHDAVWTFKGTSVQAWARSLDDSGQWKFVIQTLDGKVLRDFRVSHEGIVKDTKGVQSHVWSIGEIVQGLHTKLSLPIGTDTTLTFKNAVAQLSSVLKSVSPELASFVAGVAFNNQDKLWQLFKAAKKSSEDDD
jgi:hypothetical protein